MTTPVRLRRAALVGALAAGLLAPAAHAAPTPAPPGEWTISHRGGPLQTPFIGLGADDAGNLYGSAYQRGQIVRVDAFGTSSVIAGTGQEGTPVAGDATRSPFTFLRGVSADARGTVFAADSGAHRVVRVTPSGRLSIVAGDGSDAAPTPGPALESGLNPTAVAAGPDGDVVVYDNASSQIVRIDRTGELTVIAGTGDQGDPAEGPASSSNLRSVQALAVDRDGDVYATDDAARRVLRISTSGRLSFVAGTGDFGTPTPGPARESDLQYPFGIAVDPDDNVYVSEAGTPAVLRIDPAGRLTVIAGTGSTGDAAEGPATATGLRSPVHLASGGLGALTLDDDGSPLLDLTLTPATTSIAAEPRTTRYGTASVLPVAVSGARSGAVSLRAGSSVLARADLTAGRTGLTLPATALAPGRHTLTVDYSGTGAAAASSATVDVRVRRAASTTSLAVRRATVPARQRPVVTVRSSSKGVLARGTVTITDGRQVIARRTLGRDGTITVTLPRLSRGRHTLRAAYAGSAFVDPSSSSRRTVAVTR